MKKLVIVSIICLSLVASSLGPWVDSVSAQNRPQNQAQAQAQSQANTPGTGQALEIAPPLINLTADPGQTIRTQISLRDVSSGDLIVTNEINDFVAAGEDGAPKILLNEKEVGGNPFSIKGWIEPLPQIRLTPRQIRSIPVTIKVPKDAAPGGHYGVVRFTGTPPELEGTGVSLSASLGSLILIRVNGAVKENLEVVEFSVNQNGKTSKVFQKAPVNFVQRLFNTGNIHEQPAGHVTVYDSFGKTVGAVNINLPPRNLLPNSIRKFEQPFDQSVIGNKKLFGRYKAVMKVTYGSDKKVVTDELTFWVIPYTLIAVIIITLIVAFFAIRFLLRRYNQRILSQAGRSRRR